MAIAEGENWQPGFDLDLFSKPIDGRVCAFVCTPEVVVVNYGLQDPSACRLLADSREVRVRIFRLRFPLGDDQNGPRLVTVGDFFYDLPCCKQHSSGP